ncbi:hypothetical protein KKC1_07660 [Calderihabitans maritimus]|uniref:Uncharacterized protein n=1 Tax=Calderihabitans maritimus TaxID=1246530 RepID=A0A1Z5HQL7_9FIRM|nr:hypothetical protein KKC1_07660 [Calderihabitans maritimus]
MANLDVLQAGEIAGPGRMTQHVSRELSQRINFLRKGVIFDEKTCNNR